MTRIRLGAIGLLVANVIGAGIFILPYVAVNSGWGTMVAYLLGLGFLLAVVHGSYGMVLDRVRGEHRLTGLVRAYLPKRVFGVAAFVVIGGLFFTLLAYLILSASFIRIIFPLMNFSASIALAWFLGSFPLFLKLKRIVALEFVGAMAMAAIILFVLFSANNPLAIFSTEAFSAGEWVTPFAAVLFSLAGWTAIGPMREYERRIGAAHLPGFSSIIWGTLIILILYFVFIVGIIGSSGQVSPDTLSGLSGWSVWGLKLMAFLGILAIWTSYVPIAAEIRDSLAHDFKWSHNSGTLLATLMPVALLGLGFTSFMGAIQLSGGVFLSLQYIFIILISLFAARLSPFLRRIMVLAAAVFFIAAVYELYHFVVG